MNSENPLLGKFVAYCSSHFHCSETEFRRGHSSVCQDTNKVTRIREGKDVFEQLYNDHKHWVIFSYPLQT
jgi:hypothetical protein